MRGELDWIVMKCLEKDRTRRYETANGLARDVERYLADEAVEACPPSASYRLRKFARKHRAALATVSAFAALLFLGAVVSVWQAFRARQAERIARVERDRAVVAEHVADVSPKRGGGQTARSRARPAIAAAIALRLGHPTGAGGLGQRQPRRDARPSGTAAARIGR